MKAHMVDNPYSIIFLNWTPIVKQYVVSCCSKGKFEKTNKNTCSKEIGVHVQNMITILDVILNMVGETYMAI